MVTKHSSVYGILNKILFVEKEFGTHRIQKHYFSPDI